MWYLVLVGTYFVLSTGLWEDNMWYYMQFYDLVYNPATQTADIKVYLPDLPFWLFCVGNPPTQSFEGYYFEILQGPIEGDSENPPVDGGTDNQNP
jgi:hypothetical protein